MSEAVSSDILELRRQQAEFRRAREQAERENSWMAVPALAPAAVVMGLEGAGLLAARLATRRLAGILDMPAVAPARIPARARGGETPAAARGREQHQKLRQRVLEKGWEYEPRVPDKKGSYIKPDVRTPRDYYMELKPNTPSGKAAAVSTVRRYRRITDTPVRGILYD